MFVHVVLVWALVELVLRRWSDRAAARLAGTLAVASPWSSSLAAIPYLAQPQGPVADYDTMPALRRVFRQLEPLRGHDPVLFDVSNVRVFEPYSAAVMMRMQELGIEFRVTDGGHGPPARDRAVGPTARRPTTMFQLEGVEALHYEGPACRVAMASALDPAEEDAARVSADELVAGLTAGDISVDRNQLDPESAVLVDAVTAGDASAARRLVLDGRLAAWLPSGVATGAQAPAWTAAAEGLAPWVRSIYALFAVSDAVCVDPG